MLNTNPFSTLTEVVSPLAMQGFIIAMVILIFKLEQQIILMVKILIILIFLEKIIILIQNFHS